MVAQVLKVLLLQLLGLLQLLQLRGLLLALQVFGRACLIGATGGSRHQVAHPLLLQQLDDVVLVLIHALQYRSQRC